MSAAAFEYNGLDVVDLQALANLVEVLAIAEWPDPHTMPGLPIRKLHVLDRRFDPQQGEIRLELIGVAEVPKGSHLQQIA